MSAMLSGLRGLVDGESQTHPEGLRVAEERFQRRVEVPAILQPTDCCAGQSGPFGQVCQAQPHLLAQLAEADRQGAELDGLSLRDEFIQLASVDQLIRAGPFGARSLADRCDGGLLFGREGRLVGGSCSSPPPLGRRDFVGGDGIDRPGIVADFLPDDRDVFFRSMSSRIRSR